MNTIEEALQDIRQGKMIIVVDDEDRENEGDFVMAAEKATPEAINFMARHGRGLICVPMTGERLDRLDLSAMVNENTDRLRTAFTVSVDAKAGISTGISAADRSLTIQLLSRADTRPDDLARPGHIFPLRCRPGGVLTRAGHTEASVDLSRMAGLAPAGVICEIMNEDGSMARLPQLQELARQWDMKLVTIADLIRYRRQSEKLVIRQVETRIQTQWGKFIVVGYSSPEHSEPHLALVKGELAGLGIPAPLVRVHSECFTGDVLGSMRCDCGDQLHRAMEMIEEVGRGVVLYMRQEGRGIGLINKLHAYNLQDQGFDTVEANEKLGFKADLRDYGTGAQILADLGVHELRLITNNPRKVVGLEGYGLKIIERIPLQPKINEINRNYIRTKKHKLGHELDLHEEEHHAHS
jgi:3,4-dihydroxy 2-butanone 4-phosphate synthase/GTP cyclohydrolase II